MKLRSLLYIAFALLLLNPATRADGIRWLAVGNSITQHGPNESLKWYGSPRGMAASDITKDYVHLLAKKFENSGIQVDALNIVGRLGRLSSGTIEQVSTVLTEMRAWNPTFITIQLGENEKLAELGVEEFEHRYRTVATGVIPEGQRPIVLCTGVWAPGVSLNPKNPNSYKTGTEAAIKDEIIKKICKELGYTFVPIAAYSANPANHGDGESAGVRWHPNDAGMAAYADALFKAAKKRHLSNRN